jgi:hypothetical protein
VEWYWSVALVHGPSGSGSGVFLRPDLLLTAAHVVSPAGGPAGGGVVVEAPWLGYREAAASAVRVQPGWTAPTALSFDLALVEVPAFDGLGLATGILSATEEVSIYGYPVASAAAEGNPRPSFQTGMLEREAERLYSSAFFVAGGMSGAPFVQAPAGDTRVVGIATWDGGKSGVFEFTGLCLDSPQFTELFRP